MLQPKGHVALSIREKEQGDHAKLKHQVSHSQQNVYLFPSPMLSSHTNPKLKGEHIKVYKGREADMVGCFHAFEVQNACYTALCLTCFEQLKLENEPDSNRKRIRSYEFPGCRNHSFWDMVEYTDKNGAFWCTKEYKKKNM